MSDVARSLSAIEQGDPSAAQQLLPPVYEELELFRQVRIRAGRLIWVQSARSPCR